MNDIRVFSSIRKEIISINPHNILLIFRELNSENLVEFMSKNGLCNVVLVKDNFINKSGVKTTLSDSTVIYGNFLLTGKRDAFNYKTSLAIDFTDLITARS